ncbi:Putative lipoprotein ydaJ [Listeria monocytogenes]|nr:Putative lipoprotein ydaJ [Listeria monocytogenes]
MKRFILILILLIFIGAGFFIFLRPEPKKTVSAPKETTPTSTSVQTYVKENYTAYLAESIGLYMEYLVEVNDSKTFQEQVSHLEKNFITEDNFIKWEATQKHFIKRAKNLVSNTKKYSAEQGVPVDFYDFVHKKKADTLHLSYLNIQAMQQVNYRDKAYLPIQTPIHFLQKYFKTDSFNKKKSI